MDGDRDTTGAFDPSALDAELDASTLSSEPGEPPVLIVTRGPGAGSRYRLDRDETRIGRHPEAHIFLDDVTVSRRHALIAAVDDALVLTDQGSLNGTYVGGERLDSRILVDGDELQIGRFRMLFLSAESIPDIDAGPSADGGEREH
jgi:pSer/pThr/pTyr-binding forkhead associated (FHA) protein